MGMFWVRGTGATVAVGLVVVCLLLAGGTGLQITELRVPDAIRNGSEASVVLDCDYSLLDGDNPKELVVKWYLNEKDYPSPVYQWIPKQKPQVFGALKGRLNLEYRASDDEYKMHRALQITNLTPDLSGDYKCTVSTFYNETSQSKRLIVYVPEKSLEVTQTKNDNSAVNVTCSAEGVFPEPSLAIQRQERPEGAEDVHVVQVRTDEGLYDISASVLLEDKHLDSPTTFYCELTIPDANYSVKASSTYMPGPPTTTTEEPPTTSTELVTEASLTVGNTAITRSGAPWVLAATLLLCLRL